MRPRRVRPLLRPGRLPPPTSELEAGIRATAPDYTASSVGTDDASKVRFVAVRKDLNSDGNDEILVYLMGTYFADGYSLLANIGTSSSPVMVADDTTNGYLDVWSTQSGGGAPAACVQYAFEDGKYVEQSRTPVDQVSAGTTVLADDTDGADGLVLEPGGNMRLRPFVGFRYAV